MNFIFKSVLVGAALCSFASGVARAEVFVYESDKGDYSMSYPDSWAVTENLQPDDQLTITGPGVNDYATCRVRQREDKRFLIYPVEYSSDIQRAAYSRKFWDEYLGEYEDVVVDAFKDESGLGRGFASTAEVTFKTVAGTPVRKRGIMFGTVYHDKAYIVECASEQTLYDKWRPVFLSIIKSIDFEKKIHEFPTGEYRNFKADPAVTIYGPKNHDLYTF